MKNVAGLLLTTVVAVAAGSAASRAAPPRPDVVFFLVDDLGRQDCGFMGGTQIRTPCIDKLASAGAVLTQFYVQPVCSPTRAALMTGRYPMRMGLQVGVIRPTADYGLPLAERVLPQGLKAAGYTTAICGKWHLGSFDKAYWPGARGFDHTYGHLFGAIDYFTHQRDGKPDWYRNGEPLKEEGYSTHLVAREAAKIVGGQPRDKPLFLYVPFNGVHGPHQVPESYKVPYASLKEPRRTYAGMLAAVDEAIGQIVQAVEKAGRRPNTLFIFSSDNGGPNPGVVTDNGPLRAGKGTVYEGGTRVCAFATWDGHIKAGAKVDAAMHVADWYPTLLRLAGAPTERRLPLDGRDIWPVLTEAAPSPHEWILLNTTPQGGALRVGDWKIVVRTPKRAGTANAATAEQPPARRARRANARAARTNAATVPANGVELFNLKDDPGEKSNLAAANPEKLRELRDRYDALAREAAPPKNQ